jgi:DNA-binding SARP family transcriptional activator
MLRIQTFGQFKLSLFYDDELGQKLEKIISDQSFPNSASLQAFKILLIEHHNTVSTDQLIEYIWPNSYSEFHQKMLQNAVSAIRKTFYKNGILSRQADFLVKTESGYTLNLGKRGIDYIADVEEFLLLIKKAKEAEKEGLAKMCAMLYQDAIDLYQGDFLENDRFEIWVAFTQGNLKDHYLQALLYLAEYNFQNNQLAQTENFCNRILTLDPISETAYEILIKTCRKRKLLSKAHKVFRRCKKAYRKELNTFPPLHIERLIKEF